MPSETYEKETCESPKCRKRFTPTRPWQRHCSERCANHCAYLRVTLPKRIQDYEKKLVKLSSDPEKKDRARRLETRLSGCRAEVKAFLAGR